MLRSYHQELLDRAEIPYPELVKNLRELAFINKYLGGHALTLKGVEKLLPPAFTKPLTLLDIGSGGGDNLIAIANWARRNNFPLKLIGLDVKPDCIKYAKEACADYPEISFLEMDYRLLPSTNVRPDIVVSSLFCHHLLDYQVIELLQWMRSHVKLGFVINDLHRHPVAYHCISLLTSLFSESYLVKFDAPLSVARGFTLTEWRLLLMRAGIDGAEVNWAWAFRHLIVVKNLHSAEQENK